MAATQKFDLCYQYLHQHLKLNTLLGLPFFVSRDFHSGNRLSVRLSYFYQFLTEFLVVLGFISTVVGIIVVWNDVNVFFGGISSATHSTQMLLKIILLNWKKNEFLQQLKRLNGIFERNELLKIDGGIPDFGNFTSGTLRQLKIFRYVVVAFTVFWTTLYFAPFIYNSIINYDSLRDMYSPIVSYIPFNYTVTPRYQLVVLFQAVLFYHINLKTVVIDYFVLGYIVIHILQFRYLNLTLERATQLLIDKNEDDDKAFDLRINSFLINWIKQHQDSVSAAKISIQLLSLYFLIGFAYFVIHTCVPAFVITSMLSWTLNQKVVLIFMCIFSIVNLYLLSLSGDLFNDSNEEFGITFYGPHLFGTKSLYQVIYRMLLFAARNRSKVFGFSNVYPLCSITFGAIMRMVMSCYLALNQIKGIKDEE